MKQKVWFLTAMILLIVSIVSTSGCNASSDAGEGVDAVELKQATSKQEESESMDGGDDNPVAKDKVLEEKEQAAKSEVNSSKEEEGASERISDESDPKVTEEKVQVGEEKAEKQEN